MNSTTRRIAAETWQRAQVAISNSEIEGAEFDVWWDRLAGLLRGGVARPRTWKRLKEIAGNVAGGTDDEQSASTSPGRRSMGHLTTRSGRAKRKVEPLPSWDFTQIVPPRRSTIFLQMVKQLHRLGSV